MPRFYFHLVTSDGYETDEIGTECSSTEVAYLEAINAAAEIGADAVREGRAPFDHRFEVCDEAQEVVLDVPFWEVFGRRTSRPASPPEGVYAHLAVSIQRSRDAQAGFCAALNETRRNLAATRALLSQIG